MAKLYNLARMTSNTTGTGSTIALLSAVSGYLTFALAGAANGDVIDYAIKDGSASEVGTATYSSTGPQLTGRTVTKSTNSNAAISLSGTAEVFISPRAETLITTNNIMSFRKNYIINGAMMVSQQNATNAGTTTGYYPVDQFNVNFSNAGAVSIAQVASTTPGGSPNRLRVTVTSADTSVGAGDYLYVSQKIEGLRVVDIKLGTAGALQVTLQSGVKAPAGTYCVVFLNSATNRSQVVEYTATGSDQNVLLTITGDTAGTWLATNGVGLEVRWGLMAGSTYQQAAGSWGTTNAVGSSNQFNFMGTNGNVFELFDVGLYEGSAAPAFKVPDFQLALLESQRYYYKIGGINGNYPLLQGYNSSGATSSHSIPHPVRMRTAPSGSVAGTWGGSNCSQPVVGVLGTDGFALRTTITSTGAFDVAPNSSDDIIEMNARL